MNLSIIIVNWNTKDDLLNCLSSIFKHDVEISNEVIVVDNGSRDGSVETLENAFSFIHLIKNNNNLGFARAVNKGIKSASGKYILLLNPDTQIREGTFENLLSFMDQHPEAGIVGAQLLNPDESKQNSIANFPSLSTELLNKRLLRWLFPKNFPGKEKEYTGPIEVDSVIGACMMVRREAIEKVGLLDEDYFLFFEETDWCYRMKKAGWKVYHVPQAQVYHFQGKSVEKERGRAKVEYYRSRYIFFKKHRGKFQLLLLIIGLIIKLIIEFSFIGISNILTFFRLPKIRKRFKVYAYLLWWHLRRCPERMGLKPFILHISSNGRRNG